MPHSITQLRNLGPRCAEWLEQIEIHDENDLQAIGAATAYRELVQRGIVKPHRMLLYALGGAMMDLDCMKMSRHLRRDLEDEASIN